MCLSEPLVRRTSSVRVAVMFNKAKFVIATLQLLCLYGAVESPAFDVCVHCCSLVVEKH